jgi:hypothetical protein
VAERAGLSVASIRTSARLAAASWDLSTEVRTTGAARLDPTPFHDFSEPAIEFQVVERMFLPVRPAAGEEIVLIATKAGERPGPGDACRHGHHARQPRPRDAAVDEGGTSP